MRQNSERRSVALHPDLTLRLPQLARFTGESQRRLREAIARGELRARRPGARWFFVVWSDYLAWRDAQFLPPPPEASGSPARAWARDRAASDSTPRKPEATELGEGSVR